MLVVESIEGYSSQLPFIRLRVDLAVGQHALGPELEGLHGEGDALKLLTDMDEIVDFVVGNLAVRGNLDQALLLAVHCVQRGQHLKDDGPAARAV